MEQLSPLQTIKDAYKRYLNLRPDDQPLIDAYVSTLIATLHPDLLDPVWLYVIGSAGASKTEVIRPFEGHPKAVFLSTPTSNSLMSGYSDDDNDDPSLIKLLDGRVLIFKDLTPLLAGDSRLAEKFNGELRDAFDGTCSKASGRVGLRSYKARFGVIACVTQIIESWSDTHQQLGERFLSIRINRFEPRLDERPRLAHLKAVLDRSPGKSVWQQQFATLFQTQIDRIASTLIQNPIRPTIDPDTQMLLATIADLIGHLRTTPIDGNPSEPEVSSRLVLQLQNLGLAHAVADGRTTWDASDTLLIMRVAEDTLHSLRARLIRHLAGTNSHIPLPVSLSQLMGALPGTPSAKLSEILNQFEHLSIVVRTTVAGQSLYQVTPHYFTHIRNARLFNSPRQETVPTGSEWSDEWGATVLREDE